MANDALERVRKGLRKELKPSQSRTRKILLKRAHEVSDRERLIMETWTGAFPQLLAAYTTKHKKKAPTAKVSPFYKKTIGYGLPDFAEELNYGVDLSTI